MMIAEILKRLVAKHPKLAKALEQSQTINRWEEIVGPMIAKHAQALRVQKGVLSVVVDHAIWKSELHHRKHQILERLKADGVKVEDIIFLDKKSHS